MKSTTWIIIFTCAYISLGLITVFGSYMDNKSVYNSKMKVAYGFTLAFLLLAVIGSLAYFVANNFSKDGHQSYGEPRYEY